METNFKVEWNYDILMFPKMLNHFWIMSKYCSLVSSTKFHAVLHYKYHFVKNTNGKLTSNEQYFCLWLNNRMLSKYEKHDEP